MDSDEELEAAELAGRLEDIGREMGMPVDKIRRAAQKIATDAKLVELRNKGYDQCKICGQKVPVYPDDEWQDIFDRFEKHGERRDDHVKDDDAGWVLADEQ